MTQPRSRQQPAQQRSELVKVARPALVDLLGDKPPERGKLLDDHGLSVDPRDLRLDRAAQAVVLLHLSTGGVQFVPEPQGKAPQQRDSAGAA